MKQRVRLWLRSERAFGLQSSVALPRSSRKWPPAPAEALAPTPRREMEAQSAAAARVRPFEAIERPNAMAPQGGLMAPPSVEPFSALELPVEEKRSRLIALDSNEVRGCIRCRLCETRKNTVFGEGAADAKIFFIGEGPGENEDLQGRPFVGKAGQLLDKMIAGMGLRREQVYIANIVKCRPPNNRVPAPDEVATCTPYLERQLEIIRPRGRRTGDPGGLRFRRGLRR